MKEHFYKEIKYLSFESLDCLDFITNSFSTRLGGVSDGFYSSMNLGFSNGDDSAKVYRNFARYAAAMDVSLDHIVRTHQTHTTNVRLVTKEDIFDDGILHNPSYCDVDGLICNIPGVALMTSYADCVPLYFVDPVKKAIGLSHSGWRGTIGRMGEVTCKAMTEAFGSKPEDIFCAIGPSICQDCYEVSEDVAKQFIDEFEIRDINNNPYVKPGVAPDKYQLNLWECNRQILIDAGILPENIECANLCTCCNSEWLFSHRASGGKRGNLAAFLMLNNK